MLLFIDRLESSFASHDAPMVNARGVGAGEVGVELWLLTLPSAVLCSCDANPPPPRIIQHVSG